MRALIFLLIVAGASPASAQLIQPPPRSSGGLFGGQRPPDPDRTSQELTLAMVLLGGRDDAIAPDSQTVTAGPQQSGYVTTASGTVRYWRGRASRFFEASGRAFVNSYTNLDISRLIGGDLDLQAMTEVGEKTRLTATFGTHYQPTFLMNGVSVSPTSTEPNYVPDYSTTQGVTEQRWLNSAVSGGLLHDWTRRHSTNLRYDFSQQRSFSQAGLDASDQGGSLGHMWKFRRSATLNMSYRYTGRVTQDGLGRERPFQSHNAELGMTIQKRWSATRRIEITGGAGATRAREAASVDDQSYTFVVPSASGSLRVDLMRTWSLSGDFRREVSVLTGLTPQPFITDTTSIGSGGTIARRFELTMSAGFSRGVGREGERGSFEAITGTAQLRLAISRWWSVMTNYSYYNHLMRDVAFLVPGFPRRYDRNSVRLGLTYEVPLYGAFRTN